MVFHRAKHKPNNISISLNSVPIEQVHRTKFLDVVIDNKLDWSNHISYINAKIAKGVGIICRAKKYFSSSALIKLSSLQQLFKCNKEVYTHYTRQAQHLHSMKGKSEFVHMEQNY